MESLTNDTATPPAIATAANPVTAVIAPPPPAHGSAAPPVVSAAPANGSAVLSEGQSYIPLTSLRRGATLWGMVGMSEPLRKLQERIRAAAASELSVLIVGDTGSGKELVANAIHSESRRSNRRFVAVNTGAIPRELVASELFGHLKGSYTGAIKDRDGRFLEADGGTLFLDELGTMDERTQVGLLRALEQRTIQPVGSDKEIPVNVRIVAATNCELLNEVKSQRFREDLYYRLESFVINVPPLRSRREDVPLLAAYFAERVAADDGKVVQGFTPACLHALCSYDWPGNIRELRNAVAQAVIMCSGIIDVQHLPDKFSVPAARLENGSQPPAMQPSAITLPPEVRPRTAAATLDITLTLEEGLDAMIEKIMQRSIEVCRGNVTQAAQLLGVSRKTIYNRLQGRRVIR